MAETTTTPTPAQAPADAGKGTTTEPKAEGTEPASLLGGVDGKQDGTTQQGTEGKDKPGESKDTKAAAPAELEVKLPDGVQVDAALMQGFKGVAKEVGLDSEKASKVASWYAQAQKVTAERQVQAWAKQSTDWAEQLKGDSTFGGKAFDENLSVARKAVQRFGGEELRAALDKYGVGNMPEIVRAFAKAGKAIAEDKAAVESTPKGKPLTRDERNRNFYTDMTRQQGT